MVKIERKDKEISKKDREEIEKLFIDEEHMKTDRSIAEIESV